MSSSSRLFNKLEKWNVHAYVRIRPLDSRETRSSNFEINSSEITVKTPKNHRELTRKLQFDDVFDEQVEQVTVYTKVVKPMIKEVINGFNSTVFVFGQSGTGKTHTMTGEIVDPQVSCEIRDGTGIIQRAVEDIFEQLDNQNSEYKVTLGFMELYNEKLRNLLSDEDCKLFLITDEYGNVKVEGLKPVTATNKKDALTWLKRGIDKRHTAATNLNFNSSRSHAIFTINVHVKDKQYDAFKLGKLHLVDLAGSENLVKSGLDKSNRSDVENVRFGETININKSLLTLGRVISAIADKQHIPYRESKLTRFLSDSLGGNAKTSIIGTISPAEAHFDESVNTINYAFKARLIKNKPHRNIKISMASLSKTTEEGFTMIRNCFAADPSGNGFFVSNKKHTDVMVRMNALSEQVAEWIERYETLRNAYSEREILYSNIEDDIEEDKRKHESEISRLVKELNSLKCEVEYQKSRVQEHRDAERALTEELQSSQRILTTVHKEKNQLFGKIDRTKNSESLNLETIKNFKNTIISKLTTLENQTKEFQQDGSRHSSNFSSVLGHVFDSVQDVNENHRRHLDEFNSKVQDHIRNALATTQLSRENANKELMKLDQHINERKDAESARLNEIITSVVKPAFDLMCDHFSAITTVLNNSHITLNKCLEEDESLQKKISNHEVFLEKTVDDIRHAVHTFSEKQVEVVKKVKHNQNVFRQKLKELTELEAQLQSDGTLEMNSLLEETNGLKENINRTMGTINNKSNFVVGEILNHHKTSQKDDLTTITTIEDSVRQLRETTQSTDSSIRNSIDERLQEMEISKKAEQEILATTLRGFNTVTSQLDQDNEDFSKFSEHYITDAKSLSVEKESYVEDFLREKHIFINKHVQSVQEESTHILETVSGIKSATEDYNYAVCTPSGSTPQRPSTDFRHPAQCEVQIAVDTVSQEPSTAQLGISTPRHQQGLVASGQQLEEGDENKENSAAKKGKQTKRTLKKKPEPKKQLLDVNRAIR